MFKDSACHLAIVSHGHPLSFCVITQIRLAFTHLAQWRPTWLGNGSEQTGRIQGTHHMH